MKSQPIFYKSGLLAMLLFIFTVSACKKDDKKALESEYRVIAWNYLDQSSKATVVTKVEDAQIKYLIYENQQAVSVMFNTTQDSFLGAIVIYISIVDKSVLGIAPRY